MRRSSIYLLVVTIGLFSCFRKEQSTNQAPEVNSETNRNTSDLKRLGNEILNGILEN
jgi:hypothetical protein